jgi:hypothetical protein
MVFRQPFVRSSHRNGYFPAVSRSQHLQVQGLVGYYLSCIPYGEYIAVEAGEAIIVQPERFKSGKRSIVGGDDFDGDCGTTATDLVVVFC